MSATSRNKVKRFARYREYVARELAGRLNLSITRRDGTPGCDRDVASILDGGHFDVHAAREHAKGLVALADEQTAFEDWTRARGLGPENREPGTFVDATTTWAGAGPVFGLCERLRCGHCDPLDCYGARLRGGWPGNLAQRWAEERGGDRRAPMGRSLSRLGQRILDALEGQPSECQRGCVLVSAALGRLSPAEPGDHTQPGTRVLQGKAWVECPDCNGTGHSLAGYLPEVGWSPAVRRKATDAYVAAMRRPTDRPWRMAGHLRDAIDPDESATRTTPRGEHRDIVGHSANYGSLSLTLHTLRHAGLTTLPLDERITLRGEGAGRVPLDHLPRWRRGELLHGQQREARQFKRRLVDDVTGYPRASIAAAIAREGITDVDISLAQDAIPYTVIVSFQAANAHVAREAMEAAEQLRTLLRSAAVEFRYQVRLPGEVGAVVMTVDVL